MHRNFPIVFKNSDILLKGSNVEIIFQKSKAIVQNFGINKKITFEGYFNLFYKNFKDLKIDERKTKKYREEHYLECVFSTCLTSTPSPIALVKLFFNKTRLEDPDQNNQGITNQSPFLELQVHCSFFKPSSFINHKFQEKAR